MCGKKREAKKDKIESSKGGNTHLWEGSSINGGKGDWEKKEQGKIRGGANNTSVAASKTLIPRWTDLSSKRRMEDQKLRKRGRQGEEGEVKKVLKGGEKKNLPRGNLI